VQNNLRRNVLLVLVDSDCPCRLSVLNTEGGLVSPYGSDRYCRCVSSSGLNKGTWSQKPKEGMIFGLCSLFFVLGSMVRASSMPNSQDATPATP